MDGPGHRATSAADTHFTRRKHSPTKPDHGIATSNVVSDQPVDVALLADVLGQLAQLLQQRSYLTANESLLLTQLLQDLRQSLLDQASASQYSTL
jgi:hypothetical protein